jgi:hypothetical protein
MTYLLYAVQQAGVPAVHGGRGHRVRLRLPQLLPLLPLFLLLVGGAVGWGGGGGI